MEQLLAFVRDAQWQFWGFVVGLLGIAAAFFIWWLSRQRKELAYAVHSEAPIVNPTDNVGGRLQVLFDSKDVKSLTSIVVALTNTGKAPILRTDFDKPLTIRFADGARILDARSVESEVAIAADIGYTPDAAILQPLLLNAKDEVRVSCLVEGHVRGQVRIGARIAGVSRLKRSKSFEDRLDYSVRSAVVVTANLMTAVLVAIVLFLGAIYPNSSVVELQMVAVWALVLTELPLLAYMLGVFRSG